MGIDDGDTSEDIEDETNEQQVERIYHVLLDAIPHEVCFFNVLTALAQLMGEISIVLHEGCHNNDDDDEDEELPYGNLPGSNFSKN
jgi:hypothetical protein